MYFIDRTSEFLTDVTGKGFAVGLGNFASGKVDVHTNYRSDWQDLYHQKNWIKSDPVVITGMRKVGLFEWPEASQTENVVIRAATDFGIAGGITISSHLGGHQCIVGLALDKPLTELVRKEVLQLINNRHLDHLLSMAGTLSDVQVDLVALFANGFRAKQVAAYFEISEEAVKQRKMIIQRHFGVNNFLMVVNLCAMAGLTFPRIR